MSDATGGNVATPSAESVRCSVQPARASAVLALLRWIYAPALAHRRVLLGLNLAYLAAIGLGIAYSAIDPTAQRTLFDAIGTALTSPTSALAAAGEAYLAGDLMLSIAVTFGINLVQGTVVYLMVPSLLIPFGGMLTGLLRAVLWGVLFSPFGGAWDATALPHVLTALVEGEAYVVAMLGVWLWWWPVLSASGQRWAMWRRGLASQVRILVAVAFTLLVSAVYEALEVIYLVLRT